MLDMPVIFIVFREASSSKGWTVAGKTWDTGSSISSLELGRGDREKIILASCDKTDMGVTMSSHWTRRTKDSV